MAQPFKSRLVVGIFSFIAGVCVGMALIFPLTKWYYRPMENTLSPHNLMEQMMKPFGQSLTPPGFFEDTYNISPLGSDFENYQDEKGIYYQLEIEGLQPKSLNVSVEDNQVNVEGHIEQENSGNVHFTSKFYKSFSAPEGVDITQFTTEIKDNMLIIFFPWKKQ